MKMAPEHKVLLVRALGMLAGTSPPDITRIVEKMIEDIATKDVHIVPENHIEKLVALYAELQRLNEESRKAAKLYIETVQKRCSHRFHKPDPKSYRGYTKTDSCFICGYVIEPAANKLRLMED